MRRYYAINWPFVFLAPLVAALVVFGLWASVTASYENIRLSKAINQILSTVRIARDMALNATTSPDRATNILMDKLSYVSSVGPYKLNGVRQYGFTNPWGDPVGLIMSPMDSLIKMEMPLSATACRRLIRFYSPNPAALGIKRVDVRNNAGMAIWRQVYAASEGPVPIALDNMAIRVGCGDEGGVIVALTFRLR